MTQAIQQIRIPWIPCLKIPVFVFFLAETPEDGDQGRNAHGVPEQPYKQRKGSHQCRIKQNLSESRPGQITIERPCEIN